MVGWKEILKKALSEYNRYRAPEAIAKLKNSSKDKFVIEFVGSYCHTCGFYDYFEDLQIILEDLGLRTKISSIIDRVFDAEVEFLVIGEIKR